MIKNSKDNAISYGFYFRDGWDYYVSIKKIHYSEKPKNMCGVAYPQILNLLLTSKDFAENNSYFSAEKAFDFIKNAE